ncbi:neuraminidase-like domain-containing protein [Mariniphaga sp.]|uniref:Tc toxin subunit A-related protein n=1 Tax=Mariniphaga sp. TaxID=1954475 RepID=UPI0035648690
MTKDKITITGSIISKQTNEGVPELRIEAWDKDLLIDDYLGEAVTDQGGNFKITFTQERFKELFFDKNPDLYFKIYRDERLIHSTEHSVLWNIKNHIENVRIIVDMEKVNINPGKITFRGKVAHTNGNEIGKIKVVLSEQLLRTTKMLGETTTNSDGHYSITITALSGNAAYILEVKDNNGKSLAVSDKIFQPEENNYVNLTVADVYYKGTPAFTLHKPILKKYFEELNQGSEKKPLNVEDVYFVAEQTNLKPRETFFWLRANELETETQIPAEAFYGLFKQGMPTNAKSLSSKDGKAMKEALMKAAEKSHISDTTAANSDKVVEQWNDYIVGKTLDEVPGKMDASFGEILGTVVHDKNMQKKVLNAYLSYQGPVKEFWDNLYKITNDTTITKKIQTALQLAVLTGNQPDMIKALLDENAESDNTFQNLAANDKDEWIAYVNDLSEKKNKSIVPTFIEGKDENERIEKYAARISETLETAFPTHSFFGKLAKQNPQETAFASSYNDLTTFFKNNSSFDIKNTPTISILEEGSNFNFAGVDDKNLLASELQSIQRLSAYTKNFKAMSQLKMDGLDSAYQIVTIPQTTFIHNYTSVFGSVEAATLAFKQAEKNYMHSAIIWSKSHPGLNLETTVTSAPISDPTLRTMFGTLDACECKHCASVFSPAAYYTDILNFLYSRTPDVYNELIRRRPDLVHIELSCKNTNTALPYIDLVNELLENFILTHKTPQKTVEKSYQTTWQQNELAANPEHLQYSAYNELKTAVYPHMLPFNLPVEEARVYLKHLGVQRHQLMATFFAGTKEEAFDDFDICMERINISLQEGKILTGEIIGDGSVNSGLWNFYGFDKSNGYKPLTDPADSSKQISGGLWSVALIGRVDVFLQQTDLEYKDMLTMLLCDFINPVTGKDSEGNDIRTITIQVNCECSPDTCELSKLELVGVTSAHLQKIHCFLRLWRKLGWTMFDMDRAAMAFNLSFGADIAQNKTNLKKISQAVFLSKQLNLTLENTLALWSDIGSTSYINYFKDDYPPIISLYEKLFINKAVLNPIDTAFEDPTTLSGSMDDHTTTIFAALQINSTDYDYLIEDSTVVANTNLTLANLSSLYRYALLARKLKLSVKNFLNLKKLIGTITDIFDSPLATFQFLLKTDTVKTSGFSVDQLNYILRHDYLEETAVAPEDDTISVFLSELRSSLRATKTSTAEEQRNTIVQKFSEKLKITATASGLLLQKYLKGIANPAKAMVEDFRADDFSINNFLKTYTDYKDPGNPIDFEPIFVRENPDTDASLNAQPDLFNDYIKLEKIATIINKLKLTNDELEYILNESATLSCTNLTNLPVVTAPADFNQFETLIDLIKARDAMPIGTPDFFDILDDAIGSNNKGSWLEDLCTRTNWDRTTLEALVGNSSTTSNSGLLKTEFPGDFVNGDLILQVKGCIVALKKIGLSSNLLEDAIQTDFDSTVSNAIKNAAKAKYDEAQWLKLAKPLRDDLREKQREALVAFVVAHANFNTNAGKYERWKNSDELYGYLLIDVEMKPISMTSRIKQAICSVQLFIDRVLMNLEHPNSDPTQKALKLEGDQVEEWKEWRKLYRVWEANRKIFLYPENWIEPELRDDKSPFFKDLEAQLKQNELNDANVEDAFYAYLEKLDEVARLEVVGFYHQVETGIPDEDEIDILHVFARSYSDPPKYYHRTLEDGEWTAWTKLEIDVDGNNVIPAIFNRKLCLFWLFFTQEKEEKSSVDATESVPAPHIWWKIQVAWSEFKNNKWTAKKLSKNFTTTDNTTMTQQNELDNLKNNIWISATISDDKIFIKVDHDNFYYGDFFVFNNTNTDPVDGFMHSFPLTTTNAENTSSIKQMKTANTIGQELKFLTKYYKYDSIEQFKINCNEEQYIVLEESKENIYKLVLPSNEDYPYSKNFFFQDAKNTFYVKHTTDYIAEFTKPDFGINDWEVGTIKVWNDLYYYNPEIDPIGPVTNPYLDIDQYFQDPLVDNYKLSDIMMDVQISQFNNNMENIYGSNVQLATMSKVFSEPRLESALSETSAVAVSNMSLTYSYAKAKFGLLDSGAYFGIKYSEADQFTFFNFYHAHVKTFIKYLLKLGIEGLLTRYIQTQNDTILFKDTYAPTSLVPVNTYPTNKIDFDYGGAYAQYNWELFFHVPMLIACRLKDDQRFEEARKWFHYIFDPTKSEGGNKERFWQFKRFYEEAGTQIETLEDLLKNETELAKQVEKWMDDPFKPHVIARMRISAYMRNVVMKYLDNLIAWGDNLFKRDTIESINEATNLYILAAKILGERPADIPPRAENDETAFDNIKDDLDSFSNAMMHIETMISPSVTPPSMSSSDSPNALGQMFYFCVPRNEFLMKYWDTVADRLFKIRNSMNIEGVVRTLPLFQPPIDPAMLVRAAAAGMDLSSILSDMNAELPNYRFNFILQKAIEITNEVKSLGSALLQALEKRDEEALSLLRSAHEQKVLNAVLTVKEKQVDDAKESLASVKKLKELTQLKYEYYNSRPYMNDHEKQHLNSIQIGMILSLVQGELNTIGGVLSAIPNFKLGSPFSMGATWGGHNLGEMMRAISTYMGIFASINTAQGIMSSTLGGYTRRMDDWKFQTSTASKELEQLDKQILSAEIKLDIAEKDLQNQKLQIENNEEADAFMRNKFTNQQLYDWMIGQISTVYFQSYQLAYDLAKKAEKCYQYELGEYNNTSFVKFGYWDSLKKGLLSAEKLQYDLRRMETSYYDNNARELELTKNISLMLLNPQAILDLRNNGTCTFILPEALFDLDFQGHYFRRIKSVSLSIPCVVGPYTSINATLRLLKHTTRIDTSGATYESSDYSADIRFRHVTKETHSIATSNAQNDSGVFEFNFRDERYLPFEGCGAFGEWRLELNTEKKLRMFDYNTIRDIIITMRYTAREDSGPSKTEDSGSFKKLVIGYLKSLIESTGAPTETSSGIELTRMFSLRHEFQGEWHKMFHPLDGKTHVMNFEISKECFPYFAQNRMVDFLKIYIYGFFNNSDDYLAKVTSNGADVNINLLNSAQHEGSDSATSFALGDFALLLTKGGVDVQEKDIKDLIIVLSYQLSLINS